jgi:hypothetical protein
VDFGTWDTKRQEEQADRIALDEWRVAEGNSLFHVLPELLVSNMWECSGIAVGLSWDCLESARAARLGCREVERNRDNPTSGWARVAFGSYEADGPLHFIPSLPTHLSCLMSYELPSQMKKPLQNVLYSFAEFPKCLPNILLDHRCSQIYCNVEKGNFLFHLGNME